MEGKKEGIEKESTEKPVEKRAKKLNIENENRKKQRKEYKDRCDETEYYIKNGMRHVVPYIYHHETSCKQRWIGKTILDVYCKEFGAYSEDYYEEAIATGRIRVNGNRVDANYVLKNGDALMHPPVLAEPLTILKETSDVIAINKPGSLPVHCCGSYRYNSVEMILKKEMKMQELFFLHRLDKTGVLLIAKSSAIAASLSSQLQQGGVHKVYLAIVDGLFSNSTVPSTPSICWKDGILRVDVGISPKDKKEGIMIADPSGKEAITYFSSLFYNETMNKTLVGCMPITGRTHQIRVHLRETGHPIDDDYNYNDVVKIEKRTIQPWQGIPRDYADDTLTEEALAVKYCRWCHSSESISDAEPHSIHLHAYSYILQHERFTSSFPPWDLLKYQNHKVVLSQLQVFEKAVVELEKERKLANC